MVYYRKYRPQTISDLDSENVRNTLFAVLKDPGHTPHAFLFTGPKGLGKTSTARIVAKVVNCEHPYQKEKGKASSPSQGFDEITGVKNRESELNAKRLTLNASIEPCNTCSQCLSITNGTNIDVLEIDGASNRGIDEIRDLREKVKLAPSGAKMKVYIIDEVHMLTTEAFNALLKTIEEPPPHVMFIFCTTEPHKVPATIISRCTHIAFTLATEDEIVHSLKRIVEGEKIDIEKNALQVIAHMAEGGFRDGAKILEEVVLLGNGNKITKDFVEKTYKVAGTWYLVSGMVTYLGEKKTKDALGIVEEAIKQGIEIKYFINQLLECVHKMVLDKTKVSPDNKYETLHTKYSLNDLQNLVGLLSVAYQQTKVSPIPQLPLEMAIVAYTQSVDATINYKQTNYEQRHTIDSLAKKQQAVKIQQLIKGSEVPKESKELAGQVEEQIKQNDIHSAADPATSLMENLIYKVKPYNHSVAGVLRGCKVKDISDTQITFETAYKFHKERLEDKRSYEIIGKALKEITGKELQVQIVLKAS